MFSNQDYHFIDIKERMNRNPIGSFRFLVLVLVVSILASGCDSSSFFTFRKLAKSFQPTNNNGYQQISPSPSPDSGVNLDQGQVDRVNITLKPAISPSPSPATKSVERCSLGSSETCQYQNQVNMTACLHSSSNVNSGLFLLIQNDGDSTLRVNVTISDVKSTFQEIEIPHHDVKKVQISDRGNPSILLNAGNGKCLVQLGILSVPDTNFFRHLPSYATNTTPRQKGTYLLIFTGIVVGGILVCYKFRKRGQQVNEVPYKVVEMAQTDSPNHDVETADGWDEEWDDDWDATKAVKPPQKNGNGSFNGPTSMSSDTNGWQNKWDD